MSQVIFACKVRLNDVVRIFSRPTLPSSSRQEKTPFHPINKIMRRPRPNKKHRDAGMLHKQWHECIIKPLSR